MLPLKKNNTKEDSKIIQSDFSEKEVGQLAVDVYETDMDIVIIAPISNVREDDVDIFIEDDRVIISGKRDLPEEEQEVERFIHRECYWGKFSRNIILPEEIDSQQAKASFKNGVIKIRLPKVRALERKKIEVQE